MRLCTALVTLCTVWPAAQPATAAAPESPPDSFAGRIVAPQSGTASDVQVAVLTAHDGDDVTTGQALIDPDGFMSVSYTTPAAAPILLRFAYADDAGSRRIWLAAPEPGHTEFVLPVADPTDTGSAKLDFSAADHGFRFVNRFEGSPLPASLESILGIRLDSFGLCGGMSFAAADLFLARQPPPETSTPPPAGSALYGYLYRRQSETLGGFYIEGLRFARWMALPVGTITGTAKRTHDESRKARALLDAGRPAVLGLNYVAAGAGAQAWENHQVLAIGYDAPGDGTIVFRIYDPNYPGRDDVTVRAKSVVVGTIDDPAAPDTKADIPGLECRQFLGRRDLRPVRGFFVMPYTPAVPPEDLSTTVGAPR